MKFVQTIKDIFSIEELKNRILNTLLFLVIFRLGSFVILPGLDYSLVMSNVADDGILGVIGNFLGQAFEGKSIFALGIMPYISASIVVQLLGVAVPYFQKLQKEGESGRNKMNQITRYLTIAICIVQGIAFNMDIVTPNGSDPWLLLLPETDKYFFVAYATLILIAGTMFCTWLGEKITEKGVGNGVSLLIMVGIVARFIPDLRGEISYHWSNGSVLMILIEILVWVSLVAAIIMIVQAVRQVPLSYAKQMINNKVYDGQRSYLPLRVNSAGVMPIIFAQALMILPGLVLGAIDPEKWPTLFTFIEQYRNDTSWLFVGTQALLILVFTYFYTAMTIHPMQMAEDLKRSGGFIPGVKPGLDTANYIDDILSKITLPGALFIAFIAILPAFAKLAGVVNFYQFFGGTSLLILVGVILDTVQQVDSYLIMKKYDGLMKSGKVKGRSQEPAII